jgi:hypothetical protein
MTVAKSLKNPQPLYLDISNANLNITPEQFERLCITNPNIKLELTEDGQMILSPSAIADEPVEVLSSNCSVVNEETSSKDDLPALSPEETARRVAAVERHQERRRQMWDSLTPEEKAEHDRQFEELYQLLAESRG